MKEDVFCDKDDFVGGKCAERAVIISPGAIGDCILTLPLAQFLKDKIGVSSVDMIAKSEYTNFYPGRTCINLVRSIDTIEMHRLFAARDEFEVEQFDPLVNAFSKYDWVVSFLGEKGSDFEANLIYTVLCSRGAQVCSLPFTAPAGVGEHISDFYIKEFIASNDLETEYCVEAPKQRISVNPNDIETGRGLVSKAGLGEDAPIVFMHPGSGGEHKCWHIENFVLLAEKLKVEGAVVGFLLGPAERERFGEDKKTLLSSAGVCFYPEHLVDTVRLLSVCDCFVGNDSGISHLASAMGIGTAAVFGMSDHVLYRPVGLRSEVLVSGADSFKEPRSESVDEVFNTVVRMLNN